MMSPLVLRNEGGGMSPKGGKVLGGNKVSVWRKQLQIPQAPLTPSFGESWRGFDVFPFWRLLWETVFWCRLIL